MGKLVTLFVAFIAVIAIAFGLSVVLAIPTWLLWNWLMPLLFGFTKVTLVQAWGLSFLSALLFKSSNVSSKN